MKKARLFQLLGLIGLVSLSVVFHSCKDDDDPKPVEALITEFAITNAGAQGDQRIEGVISNLNILVVVPFETNVTALIPDIKLSEGASVVPASGSTVDFSSVRSFVVTNGDVSNTYQVTVERAEPTSGVITAITFTAVSSGEVYTSSIDQAQRKVTVTLNNLQSPIVEITDITLQPAGTTYTTSTGEDIMDLSSAVANTITLSFAGEQTVYTVEANITEAGFNPDNTTTLINKSGTQTPDFLFDTESNQETTRSAAFDGRYVIVASRKGGNNVYIWDTQNPNADPQLLSLEGVSGGSWAISDVRTSEGYIYISNMVWTEGQTFKVYRWDGIADTEPEVVVSWELNVQNVRLGDAISVIGTPPQNGYIFASNFPILPDGTNTQASEFWVWNFNGSKSGEPTKMPIVPLVGLRMGQYGRVNAIPGVSDKLMVSGAEMGIAVMDMSGTILAETSEPSVQNRSFDPHVFEYNGGRYVAYTVNREWENLGAWFEILNITEGADIVEAMGNITSATIDDLRVYKLNFSRTSSMNWVGANNNVRFGENGKPRVLAFALKHGFIVQELSN